mgnify:CR=1 FL=1
MIPHELDWRFPFCPHPPAWTLDWDEIERALPEIRALADCPQDPQWHAEGNVGIHTRMVCEQLVELERWRALTEVERQIVFCAALFPDVAKPDALPTIESLTDISGRERPPFFDNIDCRPAIGEPCGEGDRKPGAQARRQGCAVGAVTALPGLAANAIAGASAGSRANREFDSPARGSAVESRDRESGP